MDNKITRRDFLEKSAKAGITAALGSTVIANTSHASYPAATSEISVVTGTGYFENTVKAVDLVGGMKKYIGKGQNVAILPNVQRWHPGTYTNPEIVRAVVRMCKEAGAAEVNCITLQQERNWEETGNKAVLDEEGANLILVDRRDPEMFRTVPIPGESTLKEAQIMKELYKNDVFINIPVIKDHAGNKFTGTLKNMMGINSSANNRSFHKDDWKTNQDSIAFLDYCIADLNKVVVPDLHVVDSTVFITTNGPMGPGELSKPHKIVAGTDRVAIDAYCTTLLGLKGSDIVMINKAHELGMGEIDLDKVNILEG